MPPSWPAGDSRPGTADPSSGWHKHAAALTPGSRQRGGSVRVRPAGIDRLRVHPDQAGEFLDDYLEHQFAEFLISVGPGKQRPTVQHDPGRPGQRAGSAGPGASFAAGLRTPGLRATGLGATGLGATGLCTGGLRTAGLVSSGQVPASGFRAPARHLAGLGAASRHVGASSGACGGTGFRAGRAGLGAGQRYGVAVAGTRDELRDLLDRELDAGQLGLPAGLELRDRLEYMIIKLLGPAAVQRNAGRNQQPAQAAPVPVPPPDLRGGWPPGLAFLHGA